MDQKITNKKIIQLFKDNYPSTNFIDGLKIKYRALICPFIDLLSHIPKDAKVGDIGCGSGQFLLLASEFTEPSEVFGIEISKRLIDNADSLFLNSGKKNFQFEVYDGITFPEKLKEMDFIFLIDVLHHVPKDSQEDFLRKLCGQLKPGAKLVLKDIEAKSPLVIFNKIHDFIFAGEIGNELSSNRVNELLRKNELEIISTSKRTMYVYPHYTIVAEKIRNRLNSLKINL